MQAAKKGNKYLNMEFFPSTNMSIPYIYFAGSNFPISVTKNNQYIDDVERFPSYSFTGQSQLDCSTSLALNKAFWGIVLKSFLEVGTQGVTLTSIDCETNLEECPYSLGDVLPTPASNDFANDIAFLLEYSSNDIIVYPYDNCPNVKTTEYISTCHVFANSSYRVEPLLPFLLTVLLLICFMKF
jgi:hypothetical protein